MPEDLTSMLIAEIRNLNAKLDTLGRTVTEVQVSLAEVQTKLAMQHVCPSPGDCTRIRADMSEMREELDAALGAIRADVESHSEVLQQVKGGWKALAWVCGACVALSSLISWAMTHLSK